MTVPVEQWWNSSDVPASLREENTWDADGTVARKTKNKKHDICLHTISVEFLINVCLPSCLPPDTRREQNPGIYLRQVKRPHRHVLSLSVWGHLFPLTELLSLN
jgi:hypothetical protein